MCLKHKYPAFRLPTPPVCKSCERLGTPHCREEEKVMQPRQQWLSSVSPTPNSQAHWALSQWVPDAHMLPFAGWLKNDLSQRAHLPLSTTRLLKLCQVPGSVSKWERDGQHGDKTCHGALAEPTHPVGLRAGTTAAVTTPQVEPEARIQEQEVY